MAFEPGKITEIDAQVLLTLIRRRMLDIATDASARAQNEGKDVLELDSDFVVAAEYHALKRASEALGQKMYLSTPSKGKRDYTLMGG